MPEGRGAEQKERGMSEPKEKRSKGKGRVAEGKDIFYIVGGAAGLSEGNANAWLKENSTMQMANSKGVVIALGPTTITFNRR